MSQTDVAAEAHCPHCGTRILQGETGCWLCQRRIAAPIERAELRQSPAPESEPANTALTFNLSSLMLVITLIAVCLGVFQIAPGLGIAAAVVSTPALIRTLVFSKRRRAKGSALTVGEKVLAFAGSVGVVLTICIGACAAFAAVCFGTAAIVCSTIGIDGNDAALGFWLATIGGIVVGLAVGGMLAWKLWPKLR